MYKVFINKELTEESYSKLIDYAMSKSDAFMLVVYRYIEDIEWRFRMPDKSKELSDSLFQKIVNSCEVAKKKAYVNESIFKKSSEQFLEDIKTYLIKERDFPTEWPGSKVVLSDGSKVDIYVYRVCEEVKSFLLRANGLFNCKYPYFPDDLCFFKNGYCWFCTVAHEEYCCVFLESDVEIKALKKMGINFKFTETNEGKSSLFYEEYKI